MTVFPYSGEDKSSCSKGFTLAEVLITLGIIGVVAAMTLPTLISNYQKRVYVTQLKKSVSVLSQGFTTMMGHDGVTRLSDTEAFGGRDRDCYDTTIMNDYCSGFREGLSNVFSGITYTPGDGTKVYGLNGREYDSKSPNKQIIRFPDGSEIYNYAFYTAPLNQEHSSGGYVGYLYLDVNGPKNPNILGRDIFNLYIGQNGTVYANGSQALSEMRSGDPNTQYWKTTEFGGYDCKVSSWGSGCAGRVLDEDKMDY